MSIGKCKECNALINHNTGLCVRDDCPSSRPECHCKSKEDCMRYSATYAGWCRVDNNNGFALNAQSDTTTEPEEKRYTYEEMPEQNGVFDFRVVDRSTERLHWFPVRDADQAKLVCDALNSAQKEPS